MLLTIIPPRPSRDGDETTALIKEIKAPIFKGEVHRLVAFQKAVLTGKPVYAVDDPRANRAWDEYVAIGKEIMR